MASIDSESKNVESDRSAPVLPDGVTPPEQGFHFGEAILMEVRANLQKAAPWVLAISSLAGVAGLLALNNARYPAPRRKPAVVARENPVDAPSAPAVSPDATSHTDTITLP